MLQPFIVLETPTVISHVYMYPQSVCETSTPATMLGMKMLPSLTATLCQLGTHSGRLARYVCHLAEFKIRVKRESALNHT